MNQLKNTLMRTSLLIIVLFVLQGCNAQEKENPKYLIGNYDLEQITFDENIDSLFSKVDHLILPHKYDSIIGYEYKIRKNYRDSLYAYFIDTDFRDEMPQFFTDINMKVEPGKITALVGLSGAGKSTIINLLEKFYTEDAGEILLDGVYLSEYDTRFFRDKIGLVLQKNHIFNGSIEENIRYGNINATQEDIVDAAKKAFIHEQIMELPQQYQSKALMLSGGQQQRIAIARMFIKNPPIIFLDEPTANLDAIATEQIKNSLDAIKKDRTVIIISHSISQIIDADHIYAMKNGRIVEEGTHEEIYQQKGVYKEIFDAMARSLNIDKIAKTLEEK